MYLTSTANHWACDIEGNGLRDDVTKVWCVCLENVLSGEKHSFLEASHFQEWLKENPDAILVGHNFLAYDAPVLNRIWGCRIGVGKIVDTLVLSMLYSPSIKGGHSLEAWGERVKHPKTDHNEWERFSRDMLEYCENDTTLTAIVFRRLAARMLSVGFTERGAELEHRAWHIIQNKQRRHGFPFKYEEGVALHASLLARKKDLEDEIYKLWPPRLECVAEYSQSCKRDGTDNAQYVRHKGQYRRVDRSSDGSYRCFEYVAFNLGSPLQRVAKLLELGWKPTQFTKAGNPQVDEDTLKAYADECGKPEIKALATWLVVSSRINMLNNWLNNYKEETRAIHGNLWLAGTLRYRHDNPNSANVPAVRVDKSGKILIGEDGSWAHECRDLYWCGDSDAYRLVGVDAKGIQLRVLANYAYSEGFAEAVLNGDPHRNNIAILGIEDAKNGKAAAKKFFYTLLMGGAGKRLAADQVQFDVHMTPKEAAAKKAEMIAAIPGFNELIDRLQAELKRTGRIKLCDGTPILVPSDHMVIPYLLQGDESRIMKQALIFADEEVRRNKLDARKVADIHDEWQWVVHKDHVEKFIDVVLPCFNRAGKVFDYRIPIDGDAKVGKTWAETH